MAQKRREKANQVPLNTLNAEKQSSNIITEKQNPPKVVGNSIRSKVKKSNAWISPAMKVVIFTLLATGFVIFYLKPKLVGQNASAGLYSPPVSTPYKVVDMPGKGKGMVAARDIKRGELLLREEPLFLFPTSINTSPTQMIRGLVANLSPEGKAAFDGLAAADPTVEIELSKVQTNAIAAGADKTGIFPTTARLNHGCSSAFNAVYSWREKERALFVHVIRDVKAGEELLTVYTNTKRSRDERRAFLSEHYHFHCTCAVCSLPPKESAASDERLSAISSLYNKLRSWGSDQIDGIDAISTVKRIWNLMDEEGYMSERGVLASDAAHVAAAHSDASSTAAWNELAREWFGNELGFDSDQAMKAKYLVQNPTKHAAWGTKTPMKVGGS